MRITSGVTDQVINFVAVDATDLKTRETGLTTFTVYRCRNGGTPTAMTTPTVTEADATNMPGVYELLLDEDMTIGSGNLTEEIIYHITQAAMAPVSRSIELFAPENYVIGTVTTNTDMRGTNDAALATAMAAAQTDLDIITGSDGALIASTEDVATATALAAVDGNVDLILADTGTDGVVIAAAQTVAVATSVGSVTGSVGSVVGNIGGIVGTINTLDELNTAQNIQHQVTQDAIGNLGVGTGGISAIASGFAKAGAEPETNSYTDTATIGVIHIVEDDVSSIDFYYEFNLGSSGVPQSVTWQGYAQSVGDNYVISFYNWGDAVYDSVDSMSGSAGTTQSIESFVPTLNHVGTGANAGLVRWRVLSLDGTAFATDRIYCTFSILQTGIANGSTITLDSSTTNQNLIGNNWLLELGGQAIDGSYFSGSTNVSGTATCTNGSPYIFERCTMESPLLSSEGRLLNCSFEAATFTSTGGVVDDEIVISGGESKVAGASSPILSWGSVTKATSINIRGWLGGGDWTFAALVTASIEVFHGGKHTINTGGGNVEFRGFPREIVIVLSGGETVQVIAGTGKISISGNGTGSTVNIFGSHAGVTNTATGSPTVTDSGIETDNVTANMNSINNSTDAAIKLAASAQGIEDTEVTGTPTSTTLNLLAGSTVNGVYNGRIILMTSGTNAGLPMEITDYDGGSKLCTYNATITVASGDKLVIV